MKDKEEKPELDALMDKIYESQFHEEDEDYDGNVTCNSEGAERVLKSLQNLIGNPILLDYVVKCLRKQGMSVEHKYYLIEKKETIMPFNEKIHKTKELWEKHCVEGDWGKKRERKLISKIFNDVDEAMDYIEKEKLEFFEIKEI